MVAKKKSFPLTLSIISTISITFCLASCGGEKNNVEITILQPTITKLAKDRSFYCLGNLSGEIKEDYEVKVELFDSSKKLVRYNSSSIKNNTNLKLDFDKLSYYDGSDPEKQKLITSGMPELVLDSNGNFTNATSKLTFSDTHFASFITNATTYTNFNDGLGFKDAEGKAYSSLPSGKYTLKASVLDGKEHKELTSDQAEIEIGAEIEKLFGRFSPEGHFNKLKDYAKVNNLTTLTDCMPGYWNIGEVRGDSDTFAEILPCWREANIAETLQGKANYFIYNNKATSACYNVELGSFQSQKVIDDKSKLEFFYYDLGEPELTIGNTSYVGKIVKTQGNGKIFFTRIDSLREDGIDNVVDFDKYNPVSISVVNGQNGLVKSRKFAINGLLLPIQNADADMSFDAALNVYSFKNKINKLKYTFSNGIQEFTYIKNTDTFSRKMDGWDNYSSLEFSHAFEADESWIGKNISVSVKGYDIHDTEIAAATANINLSFEID